MSWRDAPLYVETFDLSGWVIERAGSWPEKTLAQRAVEEAIGLVCSVSLALTFPVERERHLAETDRGIVRLRTVLRIAERLELLSPGGLRYAAERLSAAGRMVGGWRKRVAKRRQAAGAPAM